jgi:hypothetical protein
VLLGLLLLLLLLGTLCSNPLRLGRGNQGLQEHPLPLLHPVMQQGQKEREINVSETAG